METSFYHEYARAEDNHWWFAGRRAVLRSVLRKWLTPDPERRILDVGCGTGAMLKLLRHFGRVEGLDFSPEAIAYCRQRLGPDVVLHQGAVPEQLPRGRTYDVITALDVIEHIPDAVGALRSLRTALAPGGLLVCTVPAYAFLWGPHDEINHHCRRYVRSQLLHELEQAGLRPLWTSYFNSLLFAPIAAARLFGRLVRSSRPPQSDLQSSPSLLNGVLKTVFTTERFLIPWLSLPVGVSLLAIARAPSVELPENGGVLTSARNALPTSPVTS